MSGQNDSMLSSLVNMISGSKITDWKPVINEDAVRMDAAEKLRDAAEMCLGYCHIDPSRSAISRKRLKNLAIRAKARAAMTNEERAKADLLKAVAAARVKIMEKEGLTFGQMNDIMSSVV